MTHIATYSPEDNKLRIYPGGTRLDEELGEEYASFKAAGYKWAAKQECFVCPRWTPEAEDWAIDLAGEIGDEDYSPEERSADRAERFMGYREKRADEAGDRADKFDAGPQVFGHQNERRAERQAARHDRHRTHAVSQWSKAEYWHSRTKGVIAHALHRSSAKVRRGRLLRLESEHRKHVKHIEEVVSNWEKAKKILSLQDIDTPIQFDDNGEMTATTAAAALAYQFSNLRSHGCHYIHPRTGKESSLYSHLTNRQDPITPREAMMLYLNGDPEKHPVPPGCNADRWTKHYELRMEYEKAMLEVEGGMAADLDMEVGGWLGSHQIHSVNRSNVTGRVVSVKVMGTTSGYTAESGYTKYDTTPCLVNINVERFGEHCYRPPTPEEKEAFLDKQKADRKAAKASKPAAPKLINPAREDAERLQVILNDLAAMRYRKSGGLRELKPSEVIEMTQEKYSQLSKGTYARCETRTLHAGGGKIARRTSNMYSSAGTRYDKELGPAICKIRIGESGEMHGAERVIVITDKPQQSLPWDELMPDVQPVDERGVYMRMSELEALVGAHSNDWDNELLCQAVQLGWTVWGSNHIEWTEAGARQCQNYHLTVDYGGRVERNGDSYPIEACAGR